MHTHELTAATESERIRGHRTGKLWRCVASLLVSTSQVQVFMNNLHDLHSRAVKGSVQTAPKKKDTTINE